MRLCYVSRWLRLQGCPGFPADSDKAVPLTAIDFSTALDQARHARDKPLALPLSSTHKPANNNKPTTSSQHQHQVKSVACLLLNHISPRRSLTHSLLLHGSPITMAISKKLKVHTPTPGVPSLTPPICLNYLTGDTLPLTHSRSNASTRRLRLPAPVPPSRPMVFLSRHPRRW